MVEYYKKALAHLNGDVTSRTFPFIFNERDGPKHGLMRVHVWFFGVTQYFLDIWE